MYQSSDGESSDIGYYPSADDLDNTAGSGVFDLHYQD